MRRLNTSPAYSKGKREKKNINSQDVLSSCEATGKRQKKSAWITRLKTHSSRRVLFRFTHISFTLSTPFDTDALICSAIVLPPSSTASPSGSSSVPYTEIFLSFFFLVCVVLCCFVLFCFDDFFFESVFFVCVCVLEPSHRAKCSLMPKFGSLVTRERVLDTFRE